MSADEIIAVLNELADSAESAALADPLNKDHFNRNAQALREAATLLKPYQYNLPHSPSDESMPLPLIFEELQDMVGQQVWIEFTDGRFGDGWCAVEYANKIGASFARKGYGVFCVILAREYGVRCRVYGRPPKEASV